MPEQLAALRKARPRALEREQRNVLPTWFLNVIGVAGALISGLLVSAGGDAIVLIFTTTGRVTARVKASSIKEGFDFFTR